MAISSKHFAAVSDENCIHCGFCDDYVDCPRSLTGCIGCGACIKGCPQGARFLTASMLPATEIQCVVDGETCTARGGTTVLDFLRGLGRRNGKRNFADTGNHETLCGNGCCWNCAVLADGILVRGCVTPLRQGMKIVTDDDALRRVESKRLVTVMRPYPHRHPTVFVHGCNYHCSACHNWDMTFASRGRVLNPRETISLLRIDPQHDYWVGLSGGEPTLNRRWLVEAVRGIRDVSRDIRIQLDTNASVLTIDYIDELVEAGITDISPDLKAWSVETFMKLSGIESAPTARKFLDSSWDAVRYLNRAYHGRVFMAVSLPYHPFIHSLQEMENAGRAVAEIDRNMPVTLIEYQPAFRSRDWPFVDTVQMENVRRILKTAGLCRVIVQGGSDLPIAVDPLELALSSEEF